MSHNKLREEQACLNCKTITVGRYCHQCGQENVEFHENIWSLIRHFVEDIFHFDGKFFNSLKYLITRPGYLSQEFLRGRRKSYLHPIQFYIFTSTVFFLFFYSVADNVIHVSKKKGANELIVINDSITTSEFKTVEQYYKVQDSLPLQSRDAWGKRFFEVKNIKFKEKFGELSRKGKIEYALHKLPIVLFVMMPFFAFILKIIYIRRRNFFYVDHAIFSIHHFIVSFVIIFFYLLIGLLEKKIGSYGIFRFANIFLVLFGFYHLYKAMKNFYKQGRFKTILKFCLLNFLALFAAFISLTITFILWFIFL